MACGTRQCSKVNAQYLQTCALRGVRQPSLARNARVRRQWTQILSLFLLSFSYPTFICCMKLSSLTHTLNFLNLNVSGNIPTQPIPTVYHAGSSFVNKQLELAELACFLLHADWIAGALVSGYRKLCFHYSLKNNHSRPEKCSNHSTNVS